MLGLRLPPPQLRARRVAEVGEAEHCAPRLLLPPTRRANDCGKVSEGAPKLLLQMLCAVDRSGVAGRGDFPQRVPSFPLPVTRTKDFREVAGRGHFPHRVPSFPLPVMRAKDFGWEVGATVAGESQEQASRRQSSPSKRKTSVSYACS